MRRIAVRNGAVALSVIVDGPEQAEGPPILFVHGWPELAHSWRHQLAYFAGQGRRVAALDVRGYGESDKPEAIEAYAMSALCGDVAAVIDALGAPAILVGHDWGAPIAWQTALRHADKVAAVAGLSVPYTPMGEVPFLEAMRRLHAGRFFYQLYFQEPGVAEAEFDADPDALIKIYYGLSGEGLAVQPMRPKPEDADFLTGMALPERLPAWLPGEDLAVYRTAFAAGGWRGPLNRYRAQPIDHAERAPVAGRRIAQPAAFIAGTRDPVRYFRPGADLYADAGTACADFRGMTLIEGVGHWVQQEAPGETNAALDRFIAGL